MRATREIGAWPHRRAATSRRAAVISPRHNSASSRVRSLSGVRYAPSFCRIASSVASSKLPSAQPRADQCGRPLVCSPPATSASPSRIRPMLELGVRLPNQAMIWAGVMSGVIAASARACNVPLQRPGPPRAVFDDRVDFGECRAAVLVERITPFQQLAGDRVLALGGQCRAPGPVAMAGGLEGAHEQVMIGGGQHMQIAGPRAGQRPGAQRAVGDRLHHHHIALAGKPPAARSGQAPARPAAAQSAQARGKGMADVLLKSPRSA